MPTNRPIVVTIAGFDPSAGAGLLADCKTFEQLNVYGLAINTANTLQTESNFISINWISIDTIMENMVLFLEKYTISAVKIGIVNTLDDVATIVTTIRKYSEKTPIVWDPVLKSSTGFEFLDITQNEKFKTILQQITLITPNYNEILQFALEQEEAEKIALQTAKYCAVLLKGGHHPTQKGTDYLYTFNQIIVLKPTKTSLFPKHGSGCVLSAAITAYLARNFSLKQACEKAKIYTENFLNSNPSLLGYHYVS